MDDNLRYSQSRVNNRLLNELTGLAQGITADDNVSQTEAEYLRKWLAANSAVTDNPVLADLKIKIEDYLHDGILDDEESAKLLDTLKKFAGANFELGELRKSTSLPLDDPAPQVTFKDRQFCFTGTFAHGSRKECEQTTTDLGGTCGNLTTKTDYLVIGTYATDSWLTASYGRKIEKALHHKQKGRNIAIISEDHWTQAAEPNNSKKN